MEGADKATEIQVQACREMVVQVVVLPAVLRAQAGRTRWSFGLRVRLTEATLLRTHQIEGE